MDASFKPTKDLLTKIIGKGGDKIWNMQWLRDELVKYVIIISTLPLHCKA